ncbi:MAG: PilZ domain-containing protein [Arenicellales bacterium]
MTSKDRKPPLHDDNRLQPRIRAQVRIEIRNTREDRIHTALLENLSWGGASIRCESSPGVPGDELEIRLPYKPGQPIVIASEVLRVERDGEGHIMAVRFVSVKTHDERHLEEVLEMLLAGPGGGRRQHPRLAQRLEIFFDDPADVRATLEDISHGGIAVTVPYHFNVGQSVQLTIYAGSQIGELSLRARVAHEAPSEDPGPGLFRVGLKLEHPAKDLHRLVKYLLGKMERSEAFASGGWVEK